MTLKRMSSMIALVTSLGLAAPAVAQDAPAVAAGAAPSEAAAAPTTGSTPANGSAPAAAAAGSPRERRRAAKADTELAVRLIAAQKFDEAIAALSRAYALDPKPEHIYSLGAAQHLKGDKRAARARYQEFLASGSTNRSLVQQARRFAAQLDAEIAAEELAVQRETERVAAEQAREQEARDKEARDRAARDREQADRAERDRAERERVERARAAATPARTGAGRGKRLIGAGGLAVGGVALGAAVAAGLEARSAQRKLDGLGAGDTWTVSRDWLHDRGEAADRRALILSVTGGALVVGGAVIYYLGERDARRADAERRVVIAPILHAGGAGVGLAGRF